MALTITIVSAHYCQAWCTEEDLNRSISDQFFTIFFLFSSLPVLRLHGLAVHIHGLRLDRTNFIPVFSSFMRDRYASLGTERENSIDTGNLDSKAAGSSQHLNEFDPKSKSNFSFRSLSLQERRDSTDCINEIESFSI